MSFNSDTHRANQYSRKSRTFDDTRLSRKEREALYRRQARLTRERDRFPFSHYCESPKLRAAIAHRLEGN